MSKVAQVGQRSKTMKMSRDDTVGARKHLNPLTICCKTVNFSTNVLTYKVNESQ